MIAIHNIETGEVEVREMNSDELAQCKLDKATEKAKKEAEAKAKAAREALLEKLGITADEASLLLG